MTDPTIVGTVTVTQTTPLPTPLAAQIPRLTSRKFLLCLATLLSVTLLVWFAKIGDGVYSAVLIATVGAYIAGNVTQKWVEKSARQDDSILK
jgi:hypothetical protein